jgi:diaminopropionate ammonia-lyase
VLPRFVSGCHERGRPLTFDFVAPPDRLPVNLFSTGDFLRQRAFFAARPELTATPLTPLPNLARRLGLGALHVKDETSRFGLNAFKAAGALFAIGTLRDRGRIRPGDRLVCASEGNHGRAVARAAREAGCLATVYLAHTVAAARAAAIEAEGATVVRVDGTYDDAVRTMTREAQARRWTVISDTSWDGYEEIPWLIMLGYTRLFDEAEAAWGAESPPDALIVPAGVGGLLAAAACWSHWRYGNARPLVVGVEPAAAACVQVSARSGEPTTLPGPFDTVMGGLRCGEVSPAAFTAVRTLVDAYVAIDDDWALDAMRVLARPMGDDASILAGASGAASLGALMAIVREPTLSHTRDLLLRRGAPRIVVVVTEGVTEPAVLAEALARPSPMPGTP